MQRPILLEEAWREPQAVLSAFAEEDFACALVSGGGGWSYVLRQPAAILQVEPQDEIDPFSALRELLGPAGARHPDGPPFQGGVVALCTYELTARIEPVILARRPPWPDLVAARYDALLAFDHQRRRLVCIGRSLADAERARSWLGHAQVQPAEGALGEDFAAATPAETYEQIVEAVRDRIAAGELFQANLSRRWDGRLASRVGPFDLFARMVEDSPAPFSAYLRLTGLALVSNSPERFIQLNDGIAASQPIKGTRPRDPDPRRDAELAQDLIASDKDRAENLMIVDLMRNDLSRVCEPGSVEVGPLFELQSFANVHHLVSTVRGRLLDRCDAFDLLRAAFPAGSITGAPKVQAIRMIAELEAPRGPYCGSLVWAGFDGDMDSSVLIRSVALARDEQGWRFDCWAGAGLTAPSDAVAERRETEDKIAALARLITGEPG